MIEGNYTIESITQRMLEGNYTIESITQTFNEHSDFGRRVTCSISRNGDLHSTSYVRLTIPEPEIKIFTRKYVNFVIIRDKEQVLDILEQVDYEKQFYEDFFAGKISVGNEIKEETIDEYIKNCREKLDDNTYNLLDFYNTYLNII